MRTKLGRPVLLLAWASSIDAIDPNSYGIDRADRKDEFQSARIIGFRRLSENFLVCAIDRYYVAA